ncbi:cell number regulator 6 [Hordeum vulgare]|nr:cell number regulator 6 [Hordeum vulgare]
MVIAPPYRQAKPSANIKQNVGKNKKKRQRAEVGEDSKNRGSYDSSAGSGSGNTESDNDFIPANGSDAGEDESDRGNTSQKGRERRRTSGKQSPLMIRNEADKTGTDETCQIKAGATFVHVNDACGILKERHRRDVKTAGFGSIEGWKIKGSINRNLTTYIYKNMDTNTMTISFGDGDAQKEIKITKEGIHKVFGYPNGEKKTSPRPMNCNESMKVLQSELGFRNTEFTHSDLIKKLKLLVEIDREEENKKAVKIFFLIFFNKVVCGTTFPRYSRQAVMVKDMHYEDMAQMDFCQVIVETIQAGAIGWQKMKKGEKGNKDHLYGLAQGPVIMYLDSLLLPNTREMNRIAKKMNNNSTPKVNYLDEKDLKKIAKQDMKKDGKGRQDDYEFGKIKPCSL